MKPDKLTDGIYRVAAKVGNRDLFEGIWPIPHGVMLNAYVVKGTQKNAMIDLVKDWDGAAETVDAELKELSLSNGQLDYLILNHMEPDHTGAMVAFVEKHPNVEILCSEKAVPLLKHFYTIEK
ncbi:MAG: MBL fold metallo-hydrolase, partial [Spirochaetia bacterium]|nr:MBL fold metallo-hydrolase [Spirochaetia bacterium]